MSQPNPQPEQIQPQPVPMTWTIGTVQLPTGGMSVGVQVMTPVGTSVYFLDPDLAAAVSQMFASAAQQARTGLIVPAVVPPTDIEGNGAGAAGPDGR